MCVIQSAIEPQLVAIVRQIIIDERIRNIQPVELTLNKTRSIECGCRRKRIHTHRPKDTPTKPELPAGDRSS